MYFLFVCIVIVERVTFMGPIFDQCFVPSSYHIFQASNVAPTELLNCYHLWVELNIAFHRKGLYI